MVKETLQAKFGREIRRRRELLGLTLEGLAKHAGLTPNYIAAIELGKRDPSLSTIHGLARGLGIEPWELFGALPNLSPAASEAARLFDRTVAEVQEAARQLLHYYARKPRGPKHER